MSGSNSSTCACGCACFCLDCDGDGPCAGGGDALTRRDHHPRLTHLVPGQTGKSPGQEEDPQATAPGRGGRPRRRQILQGDQTCEHPRLAPLRRRTTCSSAKRQVGRRSRPTLPRRKKSVSPIVVQTGCFIYALGEQPGDAKRSLSDRYDGARKLRDRRCGLLIQRG
jgi:hypothetical protein